MPSESSDSHRPPDSSSAYEQPDPDRPASAAPTEQMLERESPAGRSQTRAHDPYAALRLPEYRSYIVGWTLAAAGGMVMETAVSWEIMRRTQQAGHIRPMLALGIIGLVTGMPVLLLSLPAGQLADRVNRKLILLVTQFVIIDSALLLAWTSAVKGPLGLMYLLLLTHAVGSAIGWPARSALLPQIVPDHLFSNAATWNSSMFQIASMVGPAVGGLFSSQRMWPAYVIDAGCAVAFFLLLLRLRPRPGGKSRQPATLATLIAGVKFVWRVKLILATITMDLFAVLLGGVTGLIPIFADRLGVSGIGYGALRAAPAVGALAMALVLAHRPPMRKAGRDLLWAVAAFGVATIIFGFSRWYWLSLAMLCLTGAFDNISVVVRHTLVQMLTPDAMRGRVSAVNNIFIGASNELGSAESNFAGLLVGPVASVVIGGIGTILVVIGVNAVWPQIRHFGSLADARPVEDEPAEPAPV